MPLLRTQLVRRPALLVRFRVTEAFSGARLLLLLLLLVPLLRTQLVRHPALLFRLRVTEALSGAPLLLLLLLLPFCRFRGTRRGVRGRLLCRPAPLALRVFLLVLRLHRGLPRTPRPARCLPA